MLQVEGRPDIIIDLTPPGAVEALKDKPFTIKEGAKFRMKATFKVQHQILSGMKYIQSVKRHGIGNKIQEMIGSYSPNTKEKPFYEKKCGFRLSLLSPIPTHWFPTEGSYTFSPPRSFPTCMIFITRNKSNFLHSRVRYSSYGHDCTWALQRS